MNIYSRIIDHVEKWGEWISITALYVIMVATSADVIGRKFFNFSIPSLFEITQDYLLIALFFFSISWVYVEGGQVRIDLFEKYIPKKVKPWVDRILDSAALIVWGLVTWRTFDTALVAFQTGEFSSNALRYPMWLAYLFVPIGFGLLTLRLIQKVVNPESILSRQRKSEDLDEIASLG